MKGYVTKSLLFLACLFFLAMNVLAANPSSLADGAQLLKGSERIAVLNELGNIERKYGVRLAVVTVKTTNKVKIGDYANQLLDSTYTDGKNGNMVLVLAMDTRDYYVATDKAMRQRISDKGSLPVLEEKFLPLLKEKNMPRLSKSMPWSPVNCWPIMKPMARPMIRMTPSVGRRCSSPWPSASAAASSSGAISSAP